MEPPRFYDRLAVGTLHLERAALVAEAATAARAAYRIPEAREESRDPAKLLLGFAAGFLDSARNDRTLAPQSIALFPVEFHDRNSDRTHVQCPAREVSNNR